MRWSDIPMTHGDGIRLLLAYALIDAIANGAMVSAYIRGLTGQPLF